MSGITNVSVLRSIGEVANLQPYFHVMKFTGDEDYPDGGTPLFKTEIAKASVPGLQPIAVMAINCGAYTTQVTESPAVVQTAAPSWPVADQNTKTILYKLNGGAEQTLAFSGTTTSRAHVAAAIDALASIRAYDDGAQVTVKTDDVGDDVTLEITGGTALTALGLEVGVNTGTDDLLLRVNNVADGTDVGAKTADTDLSSQEFEVLVISK